MKKEQALSSLRAALTASGAALATWGINDGHDWAPVIGAIMAGVSLTWGVLHHRKRGKPGTVRWSLFRKLANATGSALATYGALNPEQVESLIALVAAIGPILAAAFAWIDNDNGSGPSNPKLPIFPLALCLAILALPSCGLVVTPDGCMLGEYQRNGQSYQAGPCFSETIDGEPEIDRYRVRWANETGDSVRATYSLAPGSVLIESRLPDGTWVGWSSKSGISIDPLPEPVQNALAGQPEPVSEPVNLIP